MKKIFLPIFVLSLFLSSKQALADTRVDWYLNKNWTYVESHFRSDRDKTKLNNWSTYWNVNPYTWEIWTKKIFDFNAWGCLDSLDLEIFPKFKSVDDFFLATKYEQKQLYLKQFSDFCENYPKYLKYKNDEIEKPKNIYKLPKFTEGFSCRDKVSVEYFLEEERKNFYTTYSEYILWQNLNRESYWNIEELIKVLSNLWNSYMNEYSKLTTNSFDISEINKAAKRIKRAEYALSIISKDIEKIKQDFIDDCNSRESKEIENDKGKKENEEKKLKEEEVKIEVKTPDYSTTDKVIDELYVQYWSRLFSIIPALEKFKTTDKYKNKIDLLDHIIQKINSLKK